MLDWHTVLNLILPLPLACYLLWRYRAGLNDNLPLLGAAFLLSAMQAHPAIQSVFFHVGATGTQEYHTHGVPFFPLMYLVLGKFHLPSPALFYSGAYLGLLTTDLADLYFRMNLDHGVLPFSRYFSAIGGGGGWDGLLLLPILSALLAWFACYELKRGKRFRWMLRHQPVADTRHA
jgi:hypothetical protein